MSEKVFGTQEHSVDPNLERDKIFIEASVQIGNIVEKLVERYAQEPEVKLSDAEIGFAIYRALQSLPLTTILSEVKLCRKSR